MVVFAALVEPAGIEVVMEFVPVAFAVLAVVELVAVIAVAQQVFVVVAAAVEPVAAAGVVSVFVSVVLKLVVSESAALIHLCQQKHNCMTLSKLKP